MHMGGNRKTHSFVEGERKRRRMRYGRTIKDNSFFERLSLWVMRKTCGALAFWGIYSFGFTAASNGNGGSGGD